MSISDLDHKKRNVTDLIRLIGNTAEDDGNHAIKTPNYSILLGAGASVTSGVRSGQTLVNQWKKDIFEESTNPNGFTLDQFFLPGNAPSWYEEASSYSSLFENRYELQRHRRMFVEREVSKKNPSIGYAYLVKLIDNGYFNTVFTTNFDDLLNEAFYRFSKNRPIVCAHDSSISGITVTSSRPKIIKLHGDYLYDNIKATLRETESLETNMKMKFQEFAKDFGLIVVGYSGQDRSVMDILSYLLQHEDYFKNGIYWCIRKGDTNICGELRKLLWRDKVYYIEIDGFDELFAQLNYALNNGALPIDEAFLSRTHQENIIKQLTDNPLVNPDGKSAFLTEDFRKLRNRFENNLESDFLNFLRNHKGERTKYSEHRSAKRKNLAKKMTNEEYIELTDYMTEAYGLGNRNAVLQKLKSKDIFALEDGRFKTGLLELMSDMTKVMDDDTVRKIFDELIRLDPNNERYYEIAANRSKSHSQAIHYLTQAVSKYPKDVYIINKLTDRLLEYCNEQSVPSDCEKELKEAGDNIDLSLSLNNSINNDAYTYKHRYIRLCYENDLESITRLSDELCEKILLLSNHHPQVLSILRKCKSNKLTEEMITMAVEFYKEADNDQSVEDCYQELILWRLEHDKFEKVLETFKEFENDYHYSDDYKFLKSRLLMDHEYFEDSLKLLQDFDNTLEVIRRKLQILYILGREEEADFFF